MTAHDLVGDTKQSRVATDGGIQFTDLHAFERDLLYAVRTLEREDEPPKGLAVKEHLEPDYRDRIHHSRLYQNLNGLVDRGLLAKGEKDGRTSEYETTDEGRHLVDRRAKRLAERAGFAVEGGDDR
ncbi:MULTISPECIES: helix-turn-helix transcriptional regulator [Halorussus]|uniref:helix-turn-helix transcriptional regulator n=1 Tax=Halorussus TaxID=1070314 RepID=UPI00209E32F4|nr:helix-turn-helix transcriptional regulator [Halorussus vallis]USZ77439.1 PadR family transcriptional regulator [Halorussus vallis]